MNQRTFTFENQEIPLSLYVTTVSLKECQHYDEIFAGLHNAIKDAK